MQLSKSAIIALFLAENAAAKSGPTIIAAGKRAYEYTQTITATGAVTSGQISFEFIPNQVGLGIQGYGTMKLRMLENGMPNCVEGEFGQLASGVEGSGEQFEGDMYVEDGTLGLGKGDYFSREEANMWITVGDNQYQGVFAADATFTEGTFENSQGILGPFTMKLIDCSCPNAAVTTAKGEFDSAKSENAGFLAKNVDDVKAYSAKVVAAAKLVAKTKFADMAAKLEVVKPLATEEEKTAAIKVKADAAAALTAAESALAALPLDAANVAFAKILADIKTSNATLNEKTKAYGKAQGECLNRNLTEFLAGMRASASTGLGYASKTVEEKVAIDAQLNGVIAAFTTMIHVMRAGSNYGKMDSATQAAFNVKHQIQMGHNAGKMAEIEQKMNQNGKTDEEFAALTADEKAAILADLKWLWDINEAAMGVMSVGEMNFRTAVGYFKDLGTADAMSKAQRDTFDEFMTAQWAQKVTDMTSMMTMLNTEKTTAGYDALDAAGKLAFNTSMGDMIAMKIQQKERMMEQAKKMMIRFGYFTTMTSGQQALMKTDIDAMFDASALMQKNLMDKMKELKATAKFDEKDAAAQKKFVASAMFEMGSMMKMMMRDMMAEQDAKFKANYYTLIEAGRTAIMTEVEKARGQVIQGMMDQMKFKGDLGSTCKPLSQMKPEGGFKGNKMSAMKDIMKKGMDDSMKGDEGKGEKMMGEGEKGIKGMQEKMGGMEGMMKKMYEAADTDEGMNKMRGKMAGEMKQMMLAKPDDMDAVQKGMMTKMQGMMSKGMMNMQKGEKGDLLDLMGGQMGMMKVMGMNFGKDAAGTDMTTAFEAMAEKMKTEMAAEKPDPKAIMEAGGEGMTTYNDGCGNAELLCCGQTEEFGVWSDDYMCNTKTEIELDSLKFRCVEGATYVAAGAMSLVAAAFMMA